MKPKMENSLERKEKGPENLSRREFVGKLGAVAVAISGLKDTEAAQSRGLIENKFTNKDGKCEYMFTSPNPELAHDSANVFEREVGKALKTAYPSQIIEPDVKLQILRQGGRKLYRYIWKCEIVKPGSRDPHYSFDRRGTMKWGKTLAEAKNEVEAELGRSQKVPEMRKKHNDRGTIPPNFIRDSYAGNPKEGYWYVKEFFLVVPK